MKPEELVILLRVERVHVDRDLIAQWAGEQLIAGTLAENEYRPIHRKRGRLLLEALRQSRVSADLPAPVRSPRPAQPRDRPRDRIRFSCASPGGALHSAHRLVRTPQEEAEIGALASALYEALKSCPRTFVQGMPERGSTNIDGRFGLKELAARTMQILADGSSQLKSLD